MLSVNDLNAGYGSVHILWDICLEVADGEVIAVLGGNGAGKTSLVRAISGLIKPYGGSIRLDGQELCGLNGRAILDAGIIQVPEGRQLFTNMTVYENLELGAFTKAAKAVLHQSLAFCYTCFPRLQERGKQLAGTLSGGEQQMVAVARALIGLPKLLILDEPSLGLAPNIVDDVLGVVHGMAKNNGISVILVEQEVSKALDTADRAYVIENGRIALTGTSAEMETNEHVKKAYLGI